MQSLLEGWNWVGKGAQATGMTASLRILSSKVHLLSISLGNQGLESGGRLKRHRIQAAWSPVWSFWSQWWFGEPWRLLVLVHCVLSSPKSMQPSTRRFWSTLCFHLLTSFMEMLISFSSRTLAPAHSAKTTSKCFADHDITVLDWPAKMPDLNPIWNLWDTVFSRERWETVDPTIQQIASMPHLTDAGVCAKGAPTKYWVHKLTYFKELKLFCFANPFFDWS